MMMLPMHALVKYYQLTIIYHFWFVGLEVKKCVVEKFVLYKRNYKIQARMGLFCNASV